MKTDQLVKPGSESQFLDALHAVSGIGPSGVKWERPDRCAQARAANDIVAAVQAFMERPDKQYKKAAPAIRAQVQAFIKTSDFTQPLSDIFDTFTDTTNTDMYWMDAFKDASNRIAPGTDFWEIATLTNASGYGWKLIPEGSKVKVSTSAGEYITVKVFKTGAGIGFTDEMIRFRKLGAMLDMAEEFRRGYNIDRADRHYALLAGALSGTDLSQGATGDTDLEADIKTLNNNAFTLLNALKDTRNLPMTQEILLYVSPQYASRIIRAMGEVSQAMAGSTKRVMPYNIRPIFTFNSNLPSASTGETFAALAVVPGFKCQSATIMQPTFYTENDALSLTTLQTAFSYFGAYAESTQIRVWNFQ